MIKHLKGFRYGANPFYETPSRPHPLLQFALARHPVSRHYTGMRNTRTPFAGLLLTLLCGCQNFMDNPYFTVKESGLNWVEIRQYAITTPTQRIRVRIDGNGIITVREGTSPLVGNPFAYDINNARWEDIRESRITVPREEVQVLFQTMVDRGLFVKQEKPDEEMLKKEAVYVSANIQCKTTSSSDPVTDPELLEHLKMIVLMFYHPTPARKR